MTDLSAEYRGPEDYLPQHCGAALANSESLRWIAWRQFRPPAPGTEQTFA